MKKNKTFLLIVICVLMFALGFVTRSILDTPSKEAVSVSHQLNTKDDANYFLSKQANAKDGENYFLMGK